MTEKNVCGVKKRQGEGYCQLPAGWGTDHSGEGACKLHGGATSKNRKHGLYSKYTKHKLSSMIDKLAGDDGLLDLRKTIAFQQALILDMLNRLESGDLKFYPELVNIFSNLADKLGRNVERHKKITEGEKYVLEVNEVQQVIEQITVIIREEVKDPTRINRISDRLQEVGW